MSDIIDSEGKFTEGWSSHLPEDLRNHEVVKTTKDLPGLVSQVVNAQKMLGNAIALPKDDAPESWDKVYSKLGWPKDGKYNFKRPDVGDKPYNEQLEQKFLELAHKHRIPEKAVQGFIDDYTPWSYEAAEAAQKQAQEAQQKKVNEYVTGLKKEMGEEKAGEYLESAKRAAETVAEKTGLNTDEFKAWAAQSGFGNDPMAIKMFAGLYGLMKNDSLEKGSQASDEGEKPKYPDSPDMYKNDPKWRPWFEARGHKFK